MAPMTIGNIAKLADVGVETIRFYERQGLIEKPPRLDSGYRQYPADTVQRVRFIRRAKELGFSLKEIKELLALRVASDATCGQVKNRAEAKIEDIKGKIRSLERIKGALKRLAVACNGESSASECPILDALADNKKRVT